MKEILVVSKNVLRHEVFLIDFERVKSTKDFWYTSHRTAKSF